MKPNLRWRIRMAWNRSAFGHVMGQATLIGLGTIVVLIVASVGALMYFTR